MKQYSWHILFDLIFLTNLISYRNIVCVGHKSKKRSIFEKKSKNWKSVFQYCSRSITFRGLKMAYYWSLLNSNMNRGIASHIWVKKFFDPFRRYKSGVRPAKTSKFSKNFKKVIFSIQFGIGILLLDQKLFFLLHPRVHLG